MGEIVEITTVAKQPHHLFYKINSGTLCFQVRGPGNAGISLAKRPDQACDFWIVIGLKKRTVALRDGNEIQSVPTPNILTSHHHREFWMQWHNNVITLGRGDSDEPFFVYKEDTFGLHYITFATIGQNVNYGVQWRFEVPPLLEKIQIKELSGGIPKWKSADDQLPDGALIGGFEKEILYIIRAKHRGSLTPGKFVPSEGIGYISWGGEMHEKNDFEVLCGYDCIWVPCCKGRIPAGAVEGGYSEVSHERLYVGRASYKGHVIPGKVQPSHNVCYIPYEDREIAIQNYEILIVPEKNMQCANPFFMYDMILYETPIEHSCVPASVQFDVDFD